MYNILLFLSRNKFLYTKVELPDSFETRMYLMFIHFSILLIIFKKKAKKFNQKQYDFLFHDIENNLRELGYGDVAVNKKMKDLNKILYDILLKIEKKTQNNLFKINNSIIIKYFDKLSDNSKKLDLFNHYLTSFFNFCFELPLESMVRDCIKFDHGST